MNKAQVAGISKPTISAYLTVQCEDGTVVRGTKNFMKDFVQVVRCKDCKHSGRLWGKIYCDGFADEMVMIGEDDFCSRGERSEK